MPRKGYPVMVRFLGHVPLIRLSPGVDVLDLRRGRLRALSFDEWRGIDPAFPFRERQYRQTGPVFLELDLGRSEDETGLVDSFAAGTDDGSALLQTVYLAVLVLSAARLPPPELSMAYLVFEDHDLDAELRDSVVSTQRRRLGPAERELIVHGDQLEIFPVDEPDAGEHIAVVAGLLDRHGALVAGTLAALARTARPGFTALNETLHLVAGLESLLVERHEPLAATFARRYSVLGAQGEDPDALRAHAKRLYGLRSAVVHGRPVPVDPFADDGVAFDIARAWACVLTLRALQWFGHHPGAEVSQFREALDRGGTSPQALESLREVWRWPDG